MKKNRKIQFAAITFILLALVAITVIFFFRIPAQAGKSVKIQKDGVAKDTLPDETENDTIKGSPVSARIRKSSWNLKLINASNPLPGSFTIDLVQLPNGHAVDSRIYEDLQAMMDDARSAGLSPMICSSFRTHEKQTRLFEKETKAQMANGLSEENAKIEAAKWVAVPGTSEHESGLAVDIVSTDYQMLDAQQENTPEQQWLMDNCWKYGFILRYPTDNSSITGIGFEPWHYRYVGKETAKEITEQGLCLEEFLEMN